MFATFIAIKKDQLMVQLLRKKTNSSSNSCSGTQHSKYNYKKKKTIFIMINSAVFGKKVAVSKYVLREDLVCRERKSILLTCCIATYCQQHKTVYRFKLVKNQMRKKLL